jgi:hypothetical protein
MKKPVAAAVAFVLAALPVAVQAASSTLTLAAES